MSNVSPPKSISPTHINIACNSVNELREQDYKNLKPKARMAIDKIIGELSACKDVEILAKTAYEKFSYINKEFVAQELGVAAKYVALDMLRAYTTSVYTQLGALKEVKPPQR